jgi:senataxin
VIIMSCVAAPNLDGSACSSIGALKDSQRLNVAVTRARQLLWIVGHAKTLARHSEDWRVLTTDAKLRGEHTVIVTVLLYMCDL